MWIIRIKKGELISRVYETEQDFGADAGKEIADRIRELLTTQDEVNMVFSAAPSQNEALKCLLEQEVDWSKVNAFQFDEYLGNEKPQACYLKNTVFDKVNLKSVNYMGSGDGDAVCKDYAELLSAKGIDIVLCDFGEKAQLGVNDAQIADFNGKELVRKVELAQGSCVTLTIPAIMSSKYVFCMATTEQKKQAVFDTHTAEISEAVPATVLRKHKHLHVNLYTDRAAGELMVWNSPV